MSDNARDENLAPVEDDEPSRSQVADLRSESSLIWRGMLHATAIHFSILAFLAWNGIEQGFDDPLLLFAFHPIRFSSRHWRSGCSSTPTGSG